MFRLDCTEPHGRVHSRTRNDINYFAKVRYNEWGLAVWMLQYKFLRTPSGMDWRFLSFNAEEDAESCHLADLKNVTVGRIMSDAPSVFMW